MATAIPAPDIELGRVRDGYPALAKWIAQDPDDDPLVFRKFGRLSARSLLHLQCRLVALETELDVLDEEARSAKDVGTRQSLQRWETLVLNAKTADSVEGKIVRKLEEFESLLKKYCEPSHAMTGPTSTYTSRRDAHSPVANCTTQQAHR
jgi:hypothetical protein